MSTSDLAQILARIERRLKATNQSGEAVSKRAGTPDAIRNLRRAAAGTGSARYGITTETLARLAVPLNTTRVWLSDEIGPETLKPEPGAPLNDSIFDHVLRVPLLSWVSAGALADPAAEVDLSGAKRVHAPGLDPRGDWIALTVKGDSMDRISPPDSVIFVNRNDKRLVPNACYVIVTDDGSASYKRYRPQKPYWHPVSENKDNKPLRASEAETVRVLGRVRRTMLDL